MQYNASMIINVWITVEWYRMISNHIVVIFNCTNSIKISRKKKRRPDRRFSPDYGWSLGVPPTPSLPGGTPSRSVKTHIFLRRNHIHWWTWYYGIAPPADSDRTLSLSLICWRFGPHNKIPIDLLKTEVNRGQVRRAIDQPPQKKQLYPPRHCRRRPRLASNLRECRSNLKPSKILWLQRSWPYFQKTRYS